MRRIFYVLIFLTTLLFVGCNFSISRRKGAERLDLMVWPFNNKALNFYKELGMTAQRYILEKEL